MLNGDHLLFSSTVFSKYEQIRENLTTLNLYIVQPLEVLREKCPNTEFFLVRIQSERGKIRTRINSVFGHFSSNTQFFLRSQSHGDPNITELVYFSFYFIISFYPRKKFKRPTNINQK